VAAPTLDRTASPDTLLQHESVQFGVTSADPATSRCDVLVIGAFADGSLPPVSETIDSASAGKIATAVLRGDLGRKAGSALTLYDLPGVAATRVLLISLGPRDKFDEIAYRKALGGAAKALADGRSAEVSVTLAENNVNKRSLAWRLQHATRILGDGAYRFTATRTVGEDEKGRGPRRVVFLTSGAVTPELEAAVRRGEAIAEGMRVAKDLGNLPGNICNPAYLAETARALGKAFKFDVDVLERSDMEKLGMGAALAVGRGSDQACKFIVMQYERGKPDDHPVVLVGKGVTFDTGGISLKPSDAMDEMKFDMCGAASVFGALTTIARLGLPTNVVGIVPAVENMPGPNASRPGDVVTSMSGQTVEILNTDAEGRLALCDALTYAERFDPACVVDIATLTGACVIALGKVTSGLMANDDSLAAELLDCGTETGDRAWQLPMFDDYQDLLKSNFADVSNLGGRPAGAITAGCFLARFAGNYKWAHLDIAGTNALSGDAKGATGRPVPLLTEFLLRRVQSKVG
jgi:leucyl aminopeptidase